jgi:hypothetical protein
MGVGQYPRRFWLSCVSVTVVLLGASSDSWAQAVAPPSDIAPPGAANDSTPATAADADEDGVDRDADETVDDEATPSAVSSPADPLVITGYVDVGYAKAQGNGTSFRDGDVRLPADYGVDAFAPAVNSRGEVASTDSGGRFTNGFLPRSVGIGGTPSFLINTTSVDLRYTSPQAPVLVFTRLQYLPRFEQSGETTRVIVEQAFGRITPVKTAELAVSVGRFDSVFGIEYLENQANFRAGITPSLMARYTTGQSIGVKVFYRYQFGEASAVSINAAATNSAPFVESLQGPDRSLTGVPVAAGRLAYELSLALLSVRIGFSGAAGPRNDQVDREAMQQMWGADGRIYIARVSLAGEYVAVEQDAGSADGKLTGLGPFPFGSAFQARGFWARAAYELPSILAGFRVIAYARYDRRHASFEGFIPITVDRMTFGLHVAPWENVQIKGEVLLNRELEGAPNVPNDVYTSSLVWTW